MTVGVVLGKSVTTGTGSTAAFAFNAPVASVDELAVYTVVIATGVQTKQQRAGSGTYDYNVTINSSNNFATVTLNNNLPNTHRVIILREVEIKQETDYVAGDAFPAETHEAALDKLTYIATQLSERVDRSLKFQEALAGDVPTDITADSTARANKGLKFDGSGNLTITTGDPDEQSAAALASANAAAGSASTASTKADEAAASAVAAAGSAASAANTYDSFDDRYLGTKSSDPTQDNDGNALVAGALYFNTTAQEMRVYDGNNWIATSAAQNATILEYVYDITGTVTAITGASGTGFAENSNAAVTFGSQESVHVYLNGVQLVQGASDDYQLTPASNTVTFNTAVVSGDIVKIVVYKTFTAADAVAASTGGTFTGNVAFSGNIQADDIVEKTSGHGVEVGSDFKTTANTFLGNGGNDQVKITNSNSFSHTAFTSEYPALTIESTSASNTNYGPYISLYRNDTAGSPTPNTTKAGAIEWRVNQNNSSQNGYENNVQFMRMGLDVINVGNGTQASNFYINKREGNTRETVFQISNAQNIELPKTNQSIKLPAGGAIWFQNYNFNPSPADFVGQNITVSSNRLDDYEEGTFEAGLTCDSGTLTIDSSYNLMTYTKIGRQVTVLGQIKVGAASSATGDAAITNLPFMSFNGSEHSDYSQVSVRIFQPATATGSMTNAYIGPNSNIIILRHLTSSGTDTGMAPMLNSTSTYIMVTATYFST